MSSSQSPTRARVAAAIPLRRMRPTTEQGPRYGVALSTAFTVIAASWLGLPVSTTHIAVGSVFGVGFFREWYTRHSKRRIEFIRRKAETWEIDEPEPNVHEVRRRYLVRRSHFMTILGAWIITVPVSAALAALIYWAMFALFI